MAAAAPRGIRAADVSSGRARRSRFLPSAHRPCRHSPQGVAVPDAADYSGRDFAWIYERQDPISFLDGHVRAFAHFGGVPARYDNLRAAVVRILVSGARTLTPRFAALASHYLFEPCFCRPGEDHDKGGVEARRKALRQQVLVPIPSGATLEAINTAVLAQLDARLTTMPAIGMRFVEEQQP